MEPQIKEAIEMEINGLIEHTKSWIKEGNEVEATAAFFMGESGGQVVGLATRPVNEFMQNIEGRILLVRMLNDVQEKMEKEYSVKVWAVGVLSDTRITDRNGKHVTDAICFIYDDGEQKKTFQTNYSKKGDVIEFEPLECTESAGGMLSNLYLKRNKA